MLNKRKGNISTIIISIILIVLVLVSVPLFKTLTNSNAKTSKETIKTQQNIQEESHNFLNNNLNGSSDTPFK